MVGALRFGEGGFKRVVLLFLVGDEHVYILEACDDVAGALQRNVLVLIVVGLALFKYAVS